MQEDAGKMFLEELERLGTWLIERCEDTDDNFVYKFRAQSKGGGTSDHQVYMVLISKTGAAAQVGLSPRQIISCGCPGWKQLKGKQKGLCKHSGAALRLSRHVWQDRATASIGIRSGGIQRGYIVSHQANSKTLSLPVVLAPVSWRNFWSLASPASLELQNASNIQKLSWIRS